MTTKARTVAALVKSSEFAETAKFTQLGDAVRVLPNLGSNEEALLAFLISAGYVVGTDDLGYSTISKES